MIVGSLGLGRRIRFGGGLVLVLVEFGELLVALG